MKCIFFYMVYFSLFLIIPASYAADQNQNSADGIARPYHLIKLNSQITGKIKSILYQEGDQVKKDEVLIRLDDTLQSALVESARLDSESDARLKTAELKFVQAKYALEKLNTAFEKAAAAEWELKQAELQMKIEEMAIKYEKEEKAKARVKLLEEKTRLDMHATKAPVAGIVRRIHVEPGQTVSPGDLMIEFADLSSLKAEFFLPIEWFERVKINQTCRLYAGAPFEKSFAGQLELADAVFDSASRTFRAVFRIDNRDLSLPAGFPVRFSINEDNN